MNDDISKQVARRILTLKKSGEDDKEFAKRVGLTPQLVSNYGAGTNGAGVKAVASVLARVPRLSGAWLLNGEPPQYLSDGTDAIRLEVVRRVADGTIAAGDLRAFATPPSGGKGGLGEKGRKEIDAALEAKKKAGRRKKGA